MNTVPHSGLNDNLEIPSASGVYKITNLVNGKIYIGSTNNLSKRRNEHFCLLRQNKHSNPYLQNAWDKYGEQAFIFEVLELVLLMSLTAREQYWLNKLLPFGRKGYNIARDALSPQLGRSPSPEIREKIRQAKLGKEVSPETREKLRQTHLGRKASPETIAKIRQARLRQKITPETIEKVRQFHLGRKRSPEVGEKIRQAKLGKKRTPETIEKVRQANLGKKRTPEHIEKVRRANLGRKNTPEVIERMRQAQRARKRRQSPT